MVKYHKGLKGCKNTKSTYMLVLFACYIIFVGNSRYTLKFLLDNDNENKLKDIEIVFQRQKGWLRLPKILLWYENNSIAVFIGQNIKRDF